MFVKTTNGTLSKYPYAPGDLRRDNPKTSFPKQIPDDILAQYGVYPVQPAPAPAVDTKTHQRTQSVELVGDVWTQVWQVAQLPLNTASANVRAYRDRLLQDTDWTALSDVVMTPEMATYRQALRDITAQEGFPYAVVWPVKPE